MESGKELGVAWVTVGYTIENYVPSAVLNEAIGQVHPRLRVGLENDNGRWENPLARTRLWREVSKTAIAKSVMGAWGDEWPFDLRKRVLTMIKFIETANANS